MAPVQWSDLPGDILFTILKLLNSEIDLLRLRSVCSSWRCSLPTRTNPYSFPMKLPPLSSVSRSIITDQRSTKKHVFLRQSSLYRLSLPDHAGDPSNGWLLRVSEVRPNSNTFSLLNPLFPGRLDLWLRLPPDAIPKGFNLLDFRISEICKCYRLSRARPIAAVKKVLVLSEFLPGSDFAVLALDLESSIVSCLSYWKFGDEYWAPVDTKGYWFDDVVFFDGKCYAIGWQGQLVSFDSEFNMTVLSRSPHLLRRLNHLVVYKSYLYIAAKINLNGYDAEDEDGLPKIVRMSSNGDLTYLRGLKDDEFFLLSDYVSLGLSTKDFGGCKGNCVYMVHRRTTHSSMSYVIESNAVFDFDTLPTTTLTEEQVARVRAKIYWPPPDWLYHNSIQDPRPIHE